MDTIKVIKIIHYEENIKQLVGFHIDTPQAKTCTDTYTLLISGWALSAKVPVVAIWFSNDKINPEVLRTVQPCIPRADVFDVHPHIPAAQTSGFLVAFSVLGLPQEIELNIQVILADQTRILAGTIYLRRLTTLAIDFQTSLNPLMLTSLGRSGSTWVMRLLAEHPDIVVHRIYPYEAYNAKYWLHTLFRVLSEPVSYLDTNSPDKLFNLSLDWARYHFYQNPELSSWFNHNYLTQTAHFCCQSIDSLYTQLAKNQSKYHNKLAFFAEKFGPSHVNLLVNELYPNAREIILVRDFRDMLCSSIAFSQKIGISDFGLENVNGEAEMVQLTHYRAHSLLTYWQHRKDHAYLLRYEDLVLQPIETLQQLFTYLNVNASETIIQDILKQANENKKETKKHATTKTPINSIGRWQKDLPSSLQQACQQQLATELTAFGYTL